MRDHNYYVMPGLGPGTHAVEFRPPRPARTGDGAHSPWAVAGRRVGARIKSGHDDLIEIPIFSRAPPGSTEMWDRVKPGNDLPRHLDQPQLDRTIGAMGAGQQA